MKNLSIRSILWISYAFLSFLILFFLFGYKVYDDITTFNKTIDSRISLLSQMIAANPEVRDSILNNQIDEESKLLFEDVLNNHPTIDLIVVVNKDSIRIYHPIESMIGDIFVGSDEGPILENGIPYITQARGGTGNVQTRAFRAVYDNDEIIGFVMVSAYQKTIYNTIGSILIANLISLSIFLGVSFIIAYFMSKYIKDMLLGNEPGQLRDLYIQQSNVLDSLNDAIVVTTTDNRLVYQNKIAFDLIETVYGECNLTNINDFIKYYLSPLAKYKNEKYHKEITIKNTVLLVRTINDQSKLHNIYTINNKSELAKLANELTGVNHALSSLRAINHEHNNKLHVILGLLQLKEYEDAIKFIIDQQIKDEVSTKIIIEKIENKTIAALLLGKFSQSKELNIKFNIDPNSYLNDENDFLSTRNMLIVLGNLLENAFDALHDIDDAMINLYLKTDDKGLTMIISDNGKGISDSLLPHLYELNMSSKGENRGIGLYVIKNIIDSHKGTITHDTSENGTTFTINITKKRQKSDDR